MKVFIFIATGLVTHILNDMVGKLIGFKLGYLLIFVPWFFFSILLCKKWDKKQEIKKRNKLTAKANAEGLTVTQYLFKDVTEDCVKSCVFYINNCQYEELKTYLSTCLEDGKISKESYKLLMNEYYRK